MSAAARTAMADRHDWIECPGEPRRGRCSCGWPFGEAVGASWTTRRAFNMHARRAGTTRRAWNTHRRRKAEEGAK